MPLFGTRVTATPFLAIRVEPTKGSVKSVVIPTRKSDAPTDECLGFASDWDIDVLPLKSGGAAMNDNSPWKQTFAKCDEVTTLREKQHRSSGMRSANNPYGETHQDIELDA